MLDNVLHVMDHMQTNSEQASGVIWKTNRLYIYVNLDSLRTAELC